MADIYTFSCMWVRVGGLFLRWWPHPTTYGSHGPSQRAHDAKITSLWRQRDVALTPQWRCNCVVCPLGLIFKRHNQGCLNNPIFWTLVLCAAYRAHFISHHELWPVSVSHPIALQALLEKNITRKLPSLYIDVSRVTLCTAGQLAHSPAT